MSSLAEGIRAAVFFTGFLPSFTRVGYCVRRPTWTTQAPRFDGQRWIVTGASTGIGREIARLAALRGATVMTIARSRDRLDALAADVAAANNGGHPGTIEPLGLDLSQVSAVDRLLDLLPAFGPVDVLVNNVGALPERSVRTPEGLDAAFATNLLNPWLLTRGALERGLLNSGATIVDMSSGGMYNVALELERLEHDRPWNGALVYARHKRAQVALAAQLAADCARDGRDVRHYVMHPGWVDTPGVRHSMPAFHRLLEPLLRDVGAGADTALWLAAERPRAGADGIWFDRALRPAHVFPGTRAGDSVEALVAYLERRAADARREADTGHPG